ncbi:hypothetical protein FX988_00197 [Paraglaciecola mesophila]|uniref:Uncharacterized protein n=1 Tax=Paraglaciecola mesophila TaxID=197222 RepID=A0A857JFM2_9ALTE|nr:hypothetical protein FX988_00197 [Paraglaciecola mesophila]
MGAVVLALYPLIRVLKRTILDAYRFLFDVVNANE